MTKDHKAMRMAKATAALRLAGLIGFGIAALTLVGIASDQLLAAPGKVTRNGIEDASGNLRVPDAYRTDYEFLGSWAIAADKGAGSKEMHVVYASPGAIEAYREKGQFPNSAVLVKEVFDTETLSMTTGTVSHARKLKGWFVMVKNSDGRHAGNALWGDGWGWSWFDVGNRTKTTSTNYRKDCLACHLPAKNSDWVYVNGYAPLRR